MLEEELITIMFERFSAFQNLWNLYITIVLGIIGFIVAAESAVFSCFVRIVIIVGFIAFACVNLRALISVHKQRNTLKQLFNDSEETKYNDLVKAGSPDPEWQVMAFHIFFDVLVICLIWILPTKISTS